MKMKYFLILVCAIALLCMAAAAHAGPTLQPELEKEFGLHSSCQVFQTTNAAQGVTAILMCGSEPIDNLMDYYKQKALGSGWTMLMESKTAENCTMMLQKGSSDRCMISITQDDEANVISMGIYKD